MSERSFDKPIVIIAENYKGTNRIVFTAEEHGGKDSWIAHRLAFLSSKVQIDSGIFHAVRRMLRTFRRMDKLPTFLFEALDNVDVNALLESCHVAERLLHEGGAKGGRPYADSGIFRKFVKDTFLAADDSLRFKAMNKPFKSRMPPDSTARESISDMVDRLSPSPHPVGALPHSTIADLKRRHLEKRQATGERLEAVCNAEIQRFKESSQWIEAAKSPTAFLKNADLNRENQLREILLAMDATEDKHNHSTRSKVRFFNCNNALSFAVEMIGSIKATPWTIYLYPYFGNGNLLTAIVIHLIYFTGWNRSSVVNLETSHLIVRGDYIRLQGIKGRTSDATPPVDVRRSDTLAWWCLNFLIERHAALIKWGFEPANMLFASPIGKNKVFAQLHTPLKEIQERHNLPPFSLEQLRTEKINRNILERGRKSAMHAAGHGSPNQTDDYAEQQMNKQLNSAISLEFTNRLAIQIKENIKNGTTTWTAINRAKSIGDGSQCSNPTLPPLDAWLEGEQCNAEHCHQEGGCSNRVITIDTARLEELALTKRFYTRNWRRMFDENNERFEKKHLAHMLFATVFQRVILDSPYASLYRKIEQLIETEFPNNSVIQ